jgi:hypothetical protein
MQTHRLNTAALKYTKERVPLASLVCLAPFTYKIFTLENSPEAVSSLETEDCRNPMSPTDDSPASVFLLLFNRHFLSISVGLRVSHIFSLGSEAAVVAWWRSGRK